MAAFRAVPLPAGLSAAEAALVIDGRVEDPPVTVDMATIRELPQTTFAGHDPWDDREHSYTGVDFWRLIRWANADPEASTVRIVAANNYEASARLSDVRAHPYLLVHTIDGRPLPDDGPLAPRGRLVIAIDFDASPELDASVYKNQLVWQVRRLELR
jgi:hypothetical protein